MSKDHGALSSNTPFYKETRLEGVRKWLKEAVREVATDAAPLMDIWGTRHRVDVGLDRGHGGRSVVQIYRAGQRLALPADTFHPDVLLIQTGVCNELDNYMSQQWGGSHDQWSASGPAPNRCPYRATQAMKCGTLPLFTG